MLILGFETVGWGTMGHFLRTTSVAACGLVTSLLTALLVTVIERLTGFDVFTFSLWFIIPAGAIGTGIAAASGYYFGSLYFHTRPNLLLLLQMFGLPIFLLAFPFLGIVGLLAHWALFPASRAPVIGASGAIATLMGAYLVLFPSAKMRMVLFLGIFFKRFQVPAWAFLLYWGALQSLSLMFGSGGEDNVAYAVHVGGFAVGVLSAMVWKVSYPFAEERLSEFVQMAFRSAGDAIPAKPSS